MELYAHLSLKSSSVMKGIKMNKYPRKIFRKAIFRFLVCLVALSFIVISCGGGGGGGDGDSAEETGTNTIAIRGTLTSLTSAAAASTAQFSIRQSAQVNSNTGISDWSGAMLTATDMLGKEITSGNADSNGNFELLVPSNTGLFIRVTIGNVLLMYFFPPSDVTQIIDINPESTAEVMVLISITGLELGLPGVAVDETPENLIATIESMDKAAVAEVAETLSNGIEEGYDPQGSEITLGGADPISFEEAQKIADLISGQTHTHAINVTSSEGGSVSPSGTVTVAHGTNLEITFTADHCFLPFSVRYDDEGEVSSFPLQIGDAHSVNVERDMYIYFEFLHYAYTVRIIDDPNGNILDPLGDLEVTHEHSCDEAANYTITPNSGYEIVDVQINDASIGVTDSYTFPGDTNFLIENTIGATFAPIGSAWSGSNETQTVPAGNQGNGESYGAAINGNGQIVGMTSAANNHVKPDNNNQTDIFIYDTETGKLKKVSVSAGSTDDPFSGPHGSQSVRTSSDGRYWVFSSTDAPQASPDSAADPNSAPDIFYFDREDDVSKRIGVPNLTDRATLGADTNSASDIFYYDLEEDVSIRISVPNLVDQEILGVEANNASYEPDISNDGQHVAFNSVGQNLVLYDTNGKVDVFVVNTLTGEVMRASEPNLADQATLGVEGNDNSMWGVSLNGDGNMVSFPSFASNLILNDNNEKRDIFVRNMETGEVERINIPNLADQATLGTEANDHAYSPEISADGTKVVYDSLANNLVMGDTNDVCDNNFDGMFSENCIDVFFFDRLTGVTKRISVDSEGTQSNGPCYYPSISDDGRYAVFECYATNLVPEDTNNTCDNNADDEYEENCSDIFVHNLLTGETARVNLANDGTQSNGASNGADISGDGQYVVYDSEGDNLVPDDYNGYRDVFRTPNPLYVAP